MPRRLAQRHRSANRQPRPRVENNSRKTRFLDLPPELRNRIYHLALSRDRVLKLYFGINPNRKPHNKSLPHVENVRLIPNILATCKQIHDEATPILYGSNTFELGGCVLASNFLPNIGQSAKCVRSIIMSYRSLSHTLNGVFNSLELATGIQSLKIRIGYYSQERKIAESLLPLMRACQDTHGPGDYTSIIQSYVHPGDETYVMGMVDQDLVVAEAKYTNGIREWVPILLQGQELAALFQGCS